MLSDIIYEAEMGGHLLWYEELKFFFFFKEVKDIWNNL
jgi:hypothetical protein